MNRTQFRPLQLVDIDVKHLPGRVTAARDPNGRPYVRAQVLVFRGPRPRGVRRVEFVDGQLSRVVLEVLAESISSNGDVATEPLPTSGPHVTVLIATRDRPASLLRCLRSVRALDYHPFDVVVVDNARRPGLVWDVIEEVAGGFIDVTYVHEPIPGLSSAHNAGLRATSSDIVAITDDDVEVDPGWLGALVEQFLEHPDAGAVTGLIYPAALDYVAQARSLGARLGKGFEVRRFDLSLHRPEDPRFPVAVGRCGSGANMAFRRSVLERIGGFDLALGAGSPGAGGDDLAALHDVLVLGSAIVYQPAAIVRHHYDPDSASLARQAFSYGRGLGVYLTRCVVEDPIGFVSAAASTLIAGRLKARDPDESAIDGLARGHRLAQLRGLVSGPVRYYTGRRRAAEITPYVGGGIARVLPTARKRRAATVTPRTDGSSRPASG